MHLLASIFIGYLIFKVVSNLEAHAEPRCNHYHYSSFKKPIMKPHDVRRDIQLKRAQREQEHLAKISKPRWTDPL